LSRFFIRDRRLQPAQDQPSKRVSIVTIDFVRAGTMVEYSTASKLAAQYAATIVEVRESMQTLKRSLDSLNKVFCPEDSHAFHIGITAAFYSEQPTDVSSEKALPKVESHLERTAWRVLVNKLGIRKLMSSKRAKQLDELLEKGFVINEAGKRETLPEINEETIIGVIMSFVDNAQTFLDEAIHEEYDYWKPSPNYDKLKTNNKHTFKLERKLIKTFAFSVWRHNGKNDLGCLNHDCQRHMTALDNIMHMLDGKGQLSGYSGPLVDAIAAKRHGGERLVETDYFRAKWFSNGNLHLEFTREDLLAKFNEICGRNRLARAI
jgi:hypothetical protein